MPLTEDQAQTLAAAIRADTDPVVVDYVAQRRDDEIARVYNLPARPDFVIWRPDVTWNEIMQNGFDWMRVDNLSVGKARIWEWLFKNDAESIDATKANIRAGIIEVWRGTAADNAVRMTVWGHCTRLASRAERVFASGTGVAAALDGTGPGTTTYYGPLTLNEVSYMLNRW